MRPYNVVAKWTNNYATPSGSGIVTLVMPLALVLCVISVVHLSLLLRQLMSGDQVLSSLG